MLTQIYLLIKWPLKVKLKKLPNFILKKYSGIFLFNEKHYYANQLLLLLFIYIKKINDVSAGKMFLKHLKRCLCRGLDYLIASETGI